MITYQVLSLDVWGGEEEGTFEKNDFYNAGEIEVNGEANESEILSKMIEEGFLASHCTLESVAIHDYNAMGEYYEVKDAKSGYPLYDLQQKR